jgi:hypothetical protein
MAMEGLNQKGGCQSVHDDLFVRALYLRQGDRDVLVLSYDLLFFESDTLREFKIALRAELGLSDEQVLVNTTHTHAGPRMTHWAYSEGADAGYLRLLRAATLNAAATARDQLQPVTLSAGMTRTTLPVSRRRPQGDGKVAWAPYPQGDTCQALPFCILGNAAGQVVSLLFSVSCHPSMIYDLVISADYPGVAVRRLNEAFQTRGAIFLQGAAGDTKPRQVAGPDRWVPGKWQDVEAAGAEVAQALIAAAPSAQPCAPQLRTLATTVDWPLEPIPTPRQYRAISENQQEYPPRRRWADDMLQRLATAPLPASVPIGVHTLVLSPDVRIIGVEGEIVGEIGNHILSQFPRGVTFPLGYTNGCRIYLPVHRMLSEGGYEVDSYWEYHCPAPLAVGSEEALTEPLRAIADWVSREA